MRMRLLAAGTRMPAWVDAGFDDYAARLRGDYRLELTEIPLGERGSGDVRRAVEAEGKRMLAAAGERATWSRCRSAASRSTTEQLARWLEARAREGDGPGVLHRRAGRAGARGGRPGPAALVPVGPDPAARSRPGGGGRGPVPRRQP